MGRREDEFHFDPDLEWNGNSKEYNYADEYKSSAKEDADPPVMRANAVTYGAPAAREEEDKHRTALHALKKKLLLVPLASSVAAVSILFSAVNYDPLGMDLFASSSSSSPSTPTTPATPTTPTTPSGTVTSFPTLPNLDPDFAGTYAWSGMGSEEYVNIDGAYLHAGTVYTSSSSFSLKNVSGASYDKKTNTLTLNNFYGSYIDTNLMGNGFKIELIGDNTLDYIRIWGAMYGGSVTFTGTGTLTINKTGRSPLGVGIYLECEDSPSAIMVDKDATVDVYGRKAIIISRTTLKDAIYTMSPVTMTGGTYSTGEFVTYRKYVTDADGNVLYDENGDPLIEEATIKDVAKAQGMDLYDFSVVDENGDPSTHVLFKPQ